jgi:hypothetical protein
MLSDRMMNRLQYRNFGDHESMVACLSVNSGSGRAGMRWWELRDTGSGWNLYQEGTYAPADDVFRWMGSIAMDANGNIALAIRRDVFDDWHSKRAAEAGAIVKLSTTVTDILREDDKLKGVVTDKGEKIRGGGNYRCWRC